MLRLWYLLVHCSKLPKVTDGVVSASRYYESKSQNRFFLMAAILKDHLCIMRGF